MRVLVIRTILRNSASAVSRAWAGVAVAALLCLAAAAPARAAFVGGTVDFNTLANDACSGATSTTCDSTKTISSLLTTDFQAAGYTGTVTVTGAIASNTWTADGNVTGPGNGASSYTLANMDKNINGSSFIQNDSENVQGLGDSNAIVLSFSVPINLSSISFDYEIFPNINCQSASNCSTWPTINVTDTHITDPYIPGDTHFSLSEKGTITKGTDLLTVTNASTLGIQPGDPIKGAGIPTGTTVVSINGNVITLSKSATASETSKSFTFTGSDVTSQIFQRFADVPGLATNPGQPTATTPVGSCPSTTLNCGGSTTPPPASTYLHSPDSGSSTNELAPQLLGSSGIIALGKNSDITTLTFNDWPATIAINNITYKVPEPGSLVLLGTGLLALGILRRRKWA